MRPSGPAAKTRPNGTAAKTRPSGTAIRERERERRGSRGRENPKAQAQFRKQVACPSNVGARRSYLYTRPCQPADTPLPLPDISRTPPSPPPTPPRLVLGPLRSSSRTRAPQSHVLRRARAMARQHRCRVRARRRSRRVRSQQHRCRARARRDSSRVRVRRAGIAQGCVAAVVEWECDAAGRRWSRISMDGAVAVERTEPKEVVLSCGCPSYRSRDGPSPDVLIVRWCLEGGGT